MAQGYVNWSLLEKWCYNDALIFEKQDFVLRVDIQSSLKRVDVQAVEAVENLVEIVDNSAYQFICQLLWKYISSLPPVEIKGISRKWISSRLLDYTMRITLDGNMASW